MCVSGGGGEGGHGWDKEIVIRDEVRDDFNTKGANNNQMLQF